MDDGPSQAPPRVRPPSYPRTVPAPRVVLATRTYPPDSGAAPFRLRALVAALRARGADVTVLTSRPAPGSASGSSRDAGGPSGDSADSPGSADRAAVHRWPVLRDRSGRVRGYLPYASFDVPLLLRLLLAWRPDVVVVEPPPTTAVVVRVVAALLRVPYAYYAADVLSAAARGSGTPAPVLRALRTIERTALRGAAVVLTTSPGMADELVALGADPPRVVVVGTGADTDLFTDRPSPRDDAVSDPADTAAPDTAAPGPAGSSTATDAGGPPVLVYAGTMSEVHGARVFVEAFAKAAAEVPTARLLVLGDGAERPALQARADELVPGRATFLGQVPGEEVARHLRSARASLASVRPGGSYEFAFATKVFASTGCGTPVIYAGPGPCADLVRSGDLGWAVPWDVDAVAAAMVQALTAVPAPGDRARIAAWTREHASLDAVAARGAEQVLRVARA